MADLILSKRAQQPYTPTPNVVIEPIDPLVQQAVNKIKQSNPNFFLQVEKIVVHFGGGSGNLGYVKRGPDDNPRVIHIYKDRIKGIIQRDLGGGFNALNFEKAVQLALIEVIGHEQTHIGEKPEEFFHGESEAERGGAEMVSKMKPQFANKLMDRLVLANYNLFEIREKFVPNVPMSEANLASLIYYENGDTANFIKEAICILKSANVSPALYELHEASQFNKNNITSFIKKFGMISQTVGSDFDSIGFAFGVAHFQAQVGLKPTGKLDKLTINKLSEKIRFRDFPKNFGIVFPGQLYRGGLIEHPAQLRALRDQCGVKRIVALHDNPETPRLCSFIGLEYVPAFMEQGAPEEFGRKVFGDSVSKFLLQKPTYVCCYFGQDRTSGVIARLRTEMGWPCKLAYLEAKSYGFKDIFADFIDWFCEPTNEEPPIDTDKIRKLLGGRSPYINPELTQCLVEPTPTDMPFSNPFDGTGNPDYLTWADTVNNITPISITSPIPIGSQGI